MNKVKILHAKPKSLIRALVQRLFLKFLSKLFPEKFLSYKNKIRFIMNRGEFLIYQYSISTCLKISSYAFASYSFARPFARLMSISAQAKRCPPGPSAEALLRPIRPQPTMATLMGLTLVLTYPPKNGLDHDLLCALTCTRRWHLVHLNGPAKIPSHPIEH